MQKNFLHFFHRAHQHTFAQNPIIEIIEKGDLDQLQRFLLDEDKTTPNAYCYLFGFDELNRSVCHHAVLNNQPEILKLLIDLKAPCNVVDLNDQTPQSIAQLMNFDQCIDILQDALDKSDNNEHKSFTKASARYL